MQCPRHGVLCRIFSQLFSGSHTKGRYSLLRLTSEQACVVLVFSFRPQRPSVATQVGSRVLKSSRFFWSLPEFNTAYGIIRSKSRKSCSQPMGVLRFGNNVIWAPRPQGGHPLDPLCHCLSSFRFSAAGHVHPDSLVAWVLSEGDYYFVSSTAYDCPGCVSSCGRKHELRSIDIQPFSFA
jgi:hypothetical protein